MPLTAQELPKKPVGKHSDGSGLLFRVTTGGTRDWFLKVQHEGKRKRLLYSSYLQRALRLHYERCCYEFSKQISPS